MWIVLSLSCLFTLDLTGGSWVIFPRKGLICLFSSSREISL